MVNNLAAQVVKPGAAFELVERDMPQPVVGEVRIKVGDCGIFHGDELVKNGGFPWQTYPRVPGHEVVGVIEEVGNGVTGWKKGDDVGVGWHGGATASRARPAGAA